MFVSLQVSCAWSLQRAGDGRRAAASDPVVRRAATPDPERPAATPDPERRAAPPDPERPAAPPDPERGARGQVRGRRGVKARARARAVGRATLGEACAFGRAPLVVRLCARASVRESPLGLPGLFSGGVTPKKATQKDHPYYLLRVFAPPSGPS